MKNSLFKFTLISLIVSSCFHGDRLNEVDFSVMFHDGKSKVWIVTSKQLGNLEFIDSLPMKNDVLIFYKNGNVLSTDFNNLYNGQGNLGKWTLNSKNNELEMKFTFEKWLYHFQSSSKHKLILKPLENSDNKFELTLETIGDL